MRKITLLCIAMLVFCLQSKAQYCVDGPSSSADSNVEQVDIIGDSESAISHTGCPAVTSVEDLTALFVDVTAGNTYTLSVTFGTCGGNFDGNGEVWIDYNSDQIFDTTLETIGTSSGTPGIAPWDAPVDFTFTVPVDAANGSTRMRVTHQEGTNVTDPCTFATWGSVMDFTINISGGLDVCFDPTGFAASNLTDVTADLSWMSGATSVIDHNVEVYLTGESAALGNIPVFANGNVPTTIISATGLAEFTTYDAYITSACSSGTPPNSNLVGPLTFTTTSSCSEIIAVGVGNITANSAEISWAPGVGNDSALVEVYVAGESAAGANIPVYTNANATGGIDTATGLMPNNTAYDVYVTGQCGALGSPTQGPFSFETLCAGFTAPFTEGFENGGVIPSCWTMSGGEDWDFNLTGPNNVGNNGTITGTTITNGYYAVVDASGNDGPTVLLSPFVDVSTLTTPALSFYIISSSNTAANSQLLVEVWDGTAFNTVETLSQDTVNLAWELIISDLSGLTITGPVQVRFTFSEPSSDFEDDIAIDDVTFSELPTCIQPNMLTGTNIDPFSADLSWTENGTATAWNIELVDITSGAVQTMTETSTGVSNPFNLSGLTPSTDYEYYVQADCGTDGTSLWTGPFAFTTAVTCPEPTVLNTFNILTMSADLAWTAGGSETMWNIELVDITGGATATGMATTSGVSNPYTASDLQSNNSYEFYVQADCETGGTSLWVGPFSFTTACDALEAPYFEDFELFTTSTQPFTVENCWSASNDTYFWESAPGTDTGSNGTGPSPTITTGNYFYTEATSGIAGAVIDLTSPLVDLSGLNDPGLSFNYHMFGDGMGTLDILVNGVDNVFSLTGEQQAVDTAIFELAIIDLSMYAGQTISVVFRSTRGATFESDMAIDNVSFEELPECDPPLAIFTVVEDCVAGFSVDIDVTDLGTGISYDVQSAGVSVGTITTTGVTTVGPFPNGTAIDLTLVHPDDTICNLSENGLEDTCPPTTIGTLTLNGACGIANDTASNTIAVDEINWYLLVYDGSCTDFTIDTVGSTEDTELGIYDAIGNLISNDDDGGDGTLSLLSLTGQPAGNYYIAAGTFNMNFGATNWDVTPGDDMGNLVVNVNTVIPNDECANAEALIFGLEITADNTGGTDSLVTGDCFTGGIADLWYTFVAGAGGEVTITTTAAQFGLYSDCNGTQVGNCNEVSVAGLIDGTTYYIRVNDDGVAAKSFAPGSFTLMVSEPTASVDQFNADSLFSYYPNPVNDNLTLKAQKAINNVSVYNIIGQEVYRNAPNTLTNEVDMTGLQAGAYFVKVTVGTNVETVRIIKN